MKVRVADEKDKVLLTNEFVRFVNRDREEAERYALVNLKLDRTLLVQDQSLLLGMLHWGRREALTEGIAQIMDMRVLPTRRKRGIGGKLLEAAMADMQAYFEGRGSQLRRVYVIGPDDEVGKHLFEKHGFTCSAIMPQHYADGRAGVLYTWEPK